MFLRKSLLVLIFCGLATALQASPLVPPSASIAGIGPDWREPYAQPIVGEPVECNDIVRRIAILTPRVVVGEPVLFRILLECKTPHTKTEFLSNLTFGSDIRVRVIPGRETRIPPYEYLGIPRGSTGATATLDMEGIPFYRLDFRMGFDGETVSGATFDRPGTYRLEIAHNCVTGNSRPTVAPLGVFEIVVLPAEGQDRRALELLNDLRAFKAVHLHSARGIDRAPLLDARLLERFHRVIDDLPEARLRVHAAFVLHDYYLGEGEIEKALEILDLIRRDYHGTPHEEVATFQQVQMLRLLGREEPARILYHQMWTDPVGTQSILPRSENYRRFIESYLARLPRPGSQWMLFPEPGPDPALADASEGPSFIIPEDLQQALGLPPVLTTEIYNQIMQERGLAP